ncbi:MAG TPA: type II toxin-antitoxin system VapC family toxin [Thermoanaerobaculia bacterium]|nr:type II toxin-antitoxin system VapC family toxin [Thermoanaerobaculia bacterium]
MILVDSSGWIEFFTGGGNAAKYGGYLEKTSNVVTPTIVLHEVYKLVKGERSEEEALLAAAQMQKTRIVPLSDSLALAAADVSLEFRLAMADSIVYATARAEDADLVTSDRDLRGLPGVTFLPKPGRGRGNRVKGA